MHRVENSIRSTVSVVGVFQYPCLFSVGQCCAQQGAGEGRALRRAPQLFVRTSHRRRTQHASADHAPPRWLAHQRHTASPAEWLGVRRQLGQRHDQQT